MKHVTFFVALVLLTVAVTSLGFAGKATVQTTTPTKVVTQASPRSLVDSDLPVDRALKSSRQIDLSTQVTSPRPIIANATSTNLTTGLAGTYTIPGDFANISSAVAVLNFLGVSGDVVFELGNASYTEMGPITFGNFPGAGDFNVTIQPAAGVAVTVNFVSTLTEGKGFAFNGAQNITIDGLNTGSASLTVQYSPMSVFPTNDAFGATIYITNVSRGLAFKNMHIKGQIDNAVWADQTDGRPAIFVWSPDADGDGSKNLTFDGCTITNATYGMKVLGDNWGIDNFADGLNITNCKIGGAYGEKVNIGFLAEATKNVNFTGNIIDGIELMQTYWYNGPTEWDYDGGVFYAGGTASFMFDFGQSTGAHFLIVDGGVFNNNIYRNVSYNGAAGDGVLTYGTRVYSYNFGVAKTAVFNNNRIYNITNPGGSTSQVNGLRGPAGYVYHNSIDLSGFTVSSIGAVNGINGHSAAYNNAIKVNVTGGSASVKRPIVAGANVDYNALESASNYYISGFNGANSAALAGYNKNGTFGPINFDADLHITTGPSTAENMGRPRTLLMPDIDGDLRDTTAAGKRDAGADEFADLAIAWANDVMPLGLAYPGASTPTGINVTPTVIVKNNTMQSVGSFDVNVTITDVATTTVEFNKSVTVTGMTAGEIKNITLTDSWPVTVVGTKSIVVTTSLAGDVQASNDVASASTVVAAPYPIATTKLYTFDAGAENWTATTGPSATTDWKRKNSFNKLGSAYSGYSWVTERPLPTGTASLLTYTEGAYASSQGYSSTYPGANLLTTPWLDISGMSGTDLYISFVHSMRVEPDWDCAWMQYTVDGLNWKNLGTLNDPNGINWYNTALYKLASPNPDAFDDATAIQYGLIPDADHLPYRWATNDAGLLAGGTADGVPAGPDGWVYVQLKITPATYAEIIHAPAIKFRYIGFSDAATAVSPGGFGFDNFYIGNVAPILTGGTITGTVFRDANGNGAIDLGEAPEATKDVKVYYYGVYVTTIQTDASGVYTFNLSANSGLPGDYQFEPQIAGVAYTIPFGVTPKGTSVNHPSDGSTKTQNYGTFVGSVSGKVFEDVDNSGTKGGTEPGLGAFVVELHKDSANGFLMGSATTPVSGLYSILAPPYANYVIKQLPKTNVRLSMPATPGTYSVAVAPISGDPTANLVNQDFGNFLFAQVKLEAYVDKNGNGVKDAADYEAIPAGDGLTTWDVFKGATKIATDELGNGLLGILHNLDYGDYTFTRVTNPPGLWIKTSTPESYTVTIATSAQAATFQPLFYKISNLQGNIIEDMNGSGTKNAGELPLAGWVISMTKGATTLLDTTDVNGDYFFKNVDPGPWTIAPVLPTGWVTTFNPTAVYPKTRNIDSVNTGNDIGVFKSIVVSGVLFRDRNNSGTKDAGDEYLSGWEVILTGATASTVTTGANGEFSFTPVPRAAGYTLSFTLQPTYSCVLPVGATYAISTVSGVDVTGKDFGVYKIADDLKYRTFTYAQLSADAKLVKYKAKDAVHAAPNTANLIDLLVNLKVNTAATALQVGKSGQKSLGGKDKAYLYVTKQGDAYKTFFSKSTPHTGDARGFDFTIKGGLMLKMWKSMGADKKNDKLVAQLLTLQVNLAASINGNTDTSKNFGALLYTPAGPWGANVSIDSIASYADEVMTNWEGVPFAVYADLLTAVEAINGAFASDSAGYWTTAPKAAWGCYKSVYDVPFLKAAVAPAKTRIKVDPTLMPDAYALNQNYPNPFNPSTTLSFDLPNDAIVTLKIFNILGQEVATVLNRQEFSAGTEEVDFDASSLSSGVYLYQIVAEEMNGNGAGQTFTQVKKMMLMK